jgi:hypothetical protein
VARCLQAGAEKARRVMGIDARNRAQVRELAGDRFECRTCYDGELIHWQMMKKNGAQQESGGRLVNVQARVSRLGGDW